MKRLIIGLMLPLLVLGLFGCENEADNQAAVDQAHKVLVLGGNLRNIQGDFDLPIELVGGVKATWASSNEDVIVCDNEAGRAIVTNPNKDEVDSLEVVLTATVSKGAATKTKTFDLRVIAEYAPVLINNAAAFQAADNNLLIKVVGIVTWMSEVNTSFNNYSIFLQDGENGYYLYRAPYDESLAIAVGDKIEAYGRKATYNGLHQISFSNIGGLSVVSRLAGVPAAKDITSIVTAATTNDALKETTLPYQSTLVSISGLKIKSALVEASIKVDGSSYNVSLYTTNDLKIVIRVDTSLYGKETDALTALQTLLLGLTTNDTLTLKGTLGIYNNDVQVNLLSIDGLIKS